jgi:hypothetical protein
MELGSFLVGFVAEFPLPTDYIYQRRENKISDPNLGINKITFALLLSFASLLLPMVD